MSKETILASLTAILTSRFGIEKSLLNVENFDLMLMGNIFRLNGVSMAYLFCEVEKAFSICIPKEMLEDYGFSTVNKIVDIILKLHI